MKIFWPSTSGGFDGSAQPSETGRTDASTLAFIKRMATSFERSATRTFAAALTVGVSCTSTDVALPITR